MLWAVLAYAQQHENKFSGRISGKVIDSLLGNPIPYATISLVLEENNKVVNGTLSDDMGAFELTDIPYGRYKAYFSLIGYKTGVRRDVVISAEAPSIVSSIIY